MKFGMFTSGYQRLPLEKCFTDAAQLGYDYIELWGGYPHAFAPDVIEDYREIRRLQEHYGIPVPVYTPEHNAYPYNYMLGTEKQWRNCMAYLEVSVRAAGLIGAGQMLISVGHGGEDPVDYCRHLGSRMAHLHLVDCDGVTETHLIPGDGVLNLKQIVSDFRQAGYDGRATLELVTHYMDDPTGAAGLALQRAKELL